MLQATHAAELLVKARIAQEHPLLIFQHLPRQDQNSRGNLDLEALFADGRTYQWSDLPDRLWVSTGVTIPNRNLYLEFGRLRNCIQHFAPDQNRDYNRETLSFIFHVVDPLIHECWGLYAVDYDEDYEPYLYFVPTLIRQEILFLVSREAASCFDQWDIEWKEVSEPYQAEVRARVEAALAGAE